MWPTEETEPPCSARTLLRTVLVDVCACWPSSFRLCVQVSGSLCCNTTFCVMAISLYCQLYTLHHLINMIRTINFVCFVFPRVSIDCQLFRGCVCVFSRSLGRHHFWSQHFIYDQSSGKCMAKHKCTQSNKVQCRQA